YSFDVVGGSSIQSIWIDTAVQTFAAPSAMFSPTSEPPQQICFDNKMQSYSGPGMNSTDPTIWDPNIYKHWYRSDTPTTIDAMTVSGPIGLPWVPGGNSPLPVVQTPGSWTLNGGAVLTTGKIGPDGSTNAAELASGDATVYTGSPKLAVGDWIVFG